MNPDSGGTPQAPFCGELPRRRALQVLAGGLALPVLARLGARDAVAAGRMLHAGLETGDGAYIFRTLDPPQRRAIEAVVERIIPQTDTPGALAARVHEFVDLILTEFAERSDREHFLAGLAGLMSRSRSDHGRAFDECDAEEQLALLVQLQEEAAQKPTQSGVGSEPFIRQVKRLTLWGYYTSEIGMTRERPYDLFPGVDPGCHPAAP